MKIKTIALVASCGNIEKIENLDERISELKKYFKVKKYFDKTASYSYLADTDENRARYLEEAFLDDEADLVLSLRGGYGAIRIVDKINYDKIKNINKLYAGSSDASILAVALSSKTNIKCFHSLMVSNGFVENLKRNIEIIENDIFDISLEKINEKTSKAKLWGGNLSSIVSLLSSEKYLPNDDIILFLEDLNEPLYKIDKMLFEIYRAETLKSKIKGIIFGDFYIEKSTIMPLFESYAKMFNVPCSYTNDITHKPSNITLPYLKEVSI
ncbi:LD-carboxypeptidase [bacterium]|nr:LD-carboxypeptidase [bacterium]